MKNIKILLVSALLSFVFACQKGEQGDIGPAGAKGVSGAVGDKGEVGLSNSKGMLYSAWLEVKATDWQAAGTNAYRVAYTLQGLTSELANKGNVYFYMQPAGTSYVYPLPHSYANGLKFAGALVNANNTQGFSLNYNFVPSLGSAKVIATYKFRLVLIPAAARMAARIDWENYESVKNYLDLND